MTGSKCLFKGCDTPTTRGYFAIINGEVSTFWVPRCSRHEDERPAVAVIQEEDK